MSSFKKELTDLLNMHSKETENDTPDFVLANYLINCLDAFTIAINGRKQDSGEKGNNEYRKHNGKTITNTNHK